MISCKFPIAALHFDELGGVPALVEWANTNQTEFYKHIWKPLLPTNMKLEVQPVDFTSILEEARVRTINASEQELEKAMTLPDKELADNGF